jgi:hypothetical protein
MGIEIIYYAFIPEMACYSKIGVKSQLINWAEIVQKSKMLNEKHFNLQLYKIHYFLFHFSTYLLFMYHSALTYFLRV